MNGENPNNLNNSENNFGAMTLGNAGGNTTSGQPNEVEALNPTPMPNVAGKNVTPTQIPNDAGVVTPQPTEIDNLMDDVGPATPVENVAPTEPVARPIPGTEGLPNADVNNLMGGTVGVGTTNFGTPNMVNPTKVENIGVVPPANENEKKKKPMNKFLFILLIVVLIAGVAFGVYYFLNISKNNVKLTTKEITIGIGETIPDDVKSYASSISGNTNLCSVNIRNVNPLAIGEYKVTITCNNKTYETKVIVGDKTAPQVELNTVFKKVGTSVKVEDFVKSCTDPSNCKTSFFNTDEVNNYLQTVGGPYNVQIVAEDDNGNKETYVTELYVTSDDIFLFLGCTSNEEEVLNYNAKKVTSDIFAISRNEFAFLNVARRDYIYTFSDEAEYKQVIGNKNVTITFDNVTGYALYDDENKQLTIATDLSMDTLNSENNNAFPTNYSDIQELYKNKGYPGIQILNNYHETEKVSNTENEKSE